MGGICNMKKKYFGIKIFLIACLVFSAFLTIRPLGEEPPTVTTPNQTVNYRSSVEHNRN